MEKGNISLAKSCLNEALEKFKEAEKYEHFLLGMRRELAVPQPKENADREALPKQNIDMPGTQMLRMILTMQSLIQRNLEELEELGKDHDQLKVSFVNPYVLKEAQGNAGAKDPGEGNGYTIPDSLMQESIRLGLKGILTFKGDEASWKPILLAVVCVIFAIMALAAIVFSGGALAPLITILGSAVFAAATSGAINAIKGAVKGDFSLNNFWKEVVTGLVAGAIGGAVGVVAGVAIKGLQTAITLVRVAANAGVGAAAGMAGAGAGHLVNQGLHGRKITDKEFGKAILHGALGGVLGGGLAGLAPHGLNNIKWEILLGGFGGGLGNLVKQGVDIGMGDSKEIDGSELLETILAGGVGAGLMRKAGRVNAYRQQQKQQMVQSSSRQKRMSRDHVTTLINKLEQRIAGGCHPKHERPIALKILNKVLKKNGLPPKTLDDFGDLDQVDALYKAGDKTPAGGARPRTAEEKLNEVFKQHKRDRYGKILERQKHINRKNPDRNKRRNSLDDSGNTQIKVYFDWPEYLALEVSKHRRIVDNQMGFSKLKQPLLFRNQLNAGLAPQPSPVRRGSLSDLSQPILFEKLWTNMVPGNHVVGRRAQRREVALAPGKGRFILGRLPVESGRPKGENFASASDARRSALIDCRALKRINNVELQIGDAHQDGGGNTTIIYKVSVPYEFRGTMTSYVALQQHPYGHPHLNQDIPHYHIRPAWPFSLDQNKNEIPFRDENVYHVRVDGNGRIPRILNDDGTVVGPDIQEHYFYPPT
jgi:hypothetical protein